MAQTRRLSTSFLLPHVVFFLRSSSPSALPHQPPSPPSHRQPHRPPYVAAAATPPFIKTLCLVAPVADVIHWLSSTALEPAPPLRNLWRRKPLPQPHSSLNIVLGQPRRRSHPLVVHCPWTTITVEELMETKRHWRFPKAQTLIWWASWGHCRALALLPLPSTHVGLRLCYACINCQTYPMEC